MDDSLANMLCVTITDLSGRILEMKIDLQTPVRNLKANVAGHWEVPIECVKLFQGSSILEDYHAGGRVVLLLADYLQGSDMFLPLLMAVSLDVLLNNAMGESHLRADALSKLAECAQPGNEDAVRVALSCLEEKDESQVPRLNPTQLQLQLQKDERTAALGLLGKVALRGDTTVVTALHSLMTMLEGKRLVRNQDWLAFNSALRILGRVADADDVVSFDRVIDCLYAPDSTHRVDNLACRLAAVDALENLRSEDALDILSSLVGDQSSAMRRAATGALVRIALNRSTSAHVLAWLDAGSPLRQVALESLSRRANLGDALAIDAALKCLGDSDYDVQCAAIRLLTKVAPKGASSVQARIESVINKPSNTKDDANAKWAAIKTLELIAHADYKSCIDTFTAALRDPAATVRFAALEGLENVLAEFNDVKLEAICSLTEDVDADMRMHAVRFLARRAPMDHDDILQVITSCLADNDMRVRCEAVGALLHLTSFYGHVHVQEGILSFLHDPVAHVRRAAVQALPAVMEDEDVIAQCRELLLVEEDKHVRCELMHTIAEAASESIRAKAVGAFLAGSRAKTDALAAVIPAAV